MLWLGRQKSGIIGLGDEKCLFLDNWIQFMNGSALFHRVYSWIMRCIIPVFQAISACKGLHFPSPRSWSHSFVKSRANILKPKNTFVFSFPLTGIVSTWYFRLSTDGTVSTPFRIRPISFIISSSFRRMASCVCANAPRERMSTAVRALIFTLHSFWCGQFSQQHLGKETRMESVCRI